MVKTGSSRKISEYCSWNNKNVSKEDMSGINQAVSIKNRQLQFYQPEVEREMATDIRIKTMIFRNSPRC